MTPGTRKRRRLDLRPETCPPLEHAQFQDPGFTSFKTLFLGLFDVTRASAVAERHCFSAWDGIWHCFDLFTILY